MNKYIKVSKSYFGSLTIFFFDRVCFYLGRTDQWGIGINYSHYDKSLTLEILNLYAGISILDKTN